MVTNQDGKDPRRYAVMKLAALIVGVPKSGKKTEVPALHMHAAKKTLAAIGANSRESAAFL